MESNGSGSGTPRPATSSSIKSFGGGDDKKGFFKGKLRDLAGRLKEKAGASGGHGDGNDEGEPREEDEDSDDGGGKESMPRNAGGSMLPRRLSRRNGNGR